MASILRPKALRAGDLVAVAALSSGMEQDGVPLFERAVEASRADGRLLRQGIRPVDPTAPVIQTAKTSFGARSR
jgi:anti-sigma factor RsiW